MNDRYPFYSRLGAGQSARFGEDHVTGIHICRDVIGIAENAYLRMPSESGMKNPAKTQIVSADHDDIFIRAEMGEKAGYQKIYLAESHTSAHDEVDRGVFRDPADRPGHPLSCRAWKTQA